MKWSWNQLVIILIFFAAGIGLEELIFMQPKQVEPKKPTPVVEQPRQEEQDTPQPETPQPEEPDEPEDVTPDAAEDEGDDDPDTEDIKKITPVIQEDDGRRPVHEENFTGKLSTNSWRNPRGLEHTLSSKIRTRIHSTDPTKVMEFLVEPENRLMLAQWDMLHRADMDVLNKLMSDRKVADSLAPLLNDLPWMTSFVYDGQMTKPEVALAMIYHFRQVDPNMDRDMLEEASHGEAGESVAQVAAGVKRRIAAAVAVEFTRNGWYGEDRELSAETIQEMREIGTPVAKIYDRTKRKDKKDTYRSARERYLYFSRSWDEGTLNTGLGNQPDWLLHFICGWKSDMQSPFGSASSMRWQRDNVSAPAGNYTGMAYQVSYLPLNVFGDTIFTEWYYEPFSAVSPGLHAKVVRDVGGVCGSLSHFGASSAVANGVPAFTMGEPGHCAYAVYHNNKWHPCNSISEKRSPHWNIWGMHSWSALQMYTEMYEEGQRTRNAQLICSLADLMAAKKKPNNALKLYEMSMTMQPLNNPVWTHYLETAAKSLSRSPSKYLGVNDFVCSSVTPAHPEMSAHYLTDIIYPTLLKTLRTPRQKLIAFNSFFNNLKQNEKAEWNIEKLLNMQYDSLGNSTNAKESYLKSLAESVHKHPDFGIALSWALRRAYADNKKLGEKLRILVDKQIAELPAEEGATNMVRKLLCAAVIRAAEESGFQQINASGRLSAKDHDFFIDLANQYSKDYLENATKPMPNFVPPSGNLVSPGSIAMLDNDKYSPDQSIVAAHAAAFTSKGGRITSEKGKHVKLVVELPKRTHVGGIVLVPYAGSCSSYREWNIETSVDGKTWQILQKLPDSSPKPCIVIDIKRDSPNIKFLRIDSGAEQNLGIDFQAILVYDNKKAK